MLRIVSVKNLVVILHVLLMCVSSVNFSVGQENKTPEPVADRTTGVQSPGMLTWSVDSLKLAFADIIMLPSNEWYLYDTITNRVSSTTPELLRPHLDETASRILTQVPTSANELVQPISQSPNNRFLVFGVFNSEEQIVTNWGSFPAIQLGIADLQQKVTYTLSEVEVPNPDRVLWSDDSTAFILVQTIIPNDWVNVYYADNYDTDVSEIAFRRLTGLPIANQVYTVNGAYDLSSDGNIVLLQVMVPTGQREYKIYLYNAVFPDKDQLIQNFDATNVIAGSFAPTNETRLWLFNEEGIIQYDLMSNEVTILNTDVNSKRAKAIPSKDPAVFSPDGQRLATLQETSLYVIDLTEAAGQVANHIDQLVVTDVPEGLIRLQLTLNCPSNPAQPLTLQILNPNQETVTAVWERNWQLPGKESNTIDVPGGSETKPGEVTFEVPAEPETNQIQIYVGGTFQDTQSCVVPHEG